MDIELFEGVGKYAKVDHVAVQTAFGMMIPAKTIFEKLGYSVHPTRKAEGDWGKAVFMVKEGSISIQLTDISAGKNHILQMKQFGIMVEDPKEVSLAMYTWARRGGLEVIREELPGQKWFVRIPAILMQPIELVPCSRLKCPECDGTGEVIMGSEGRGFHYPCEKCKGKGWIPLVIPKTSFV